MWRKRNAAQFNFSNCNVVFNIFPVNICKFVLHEKLIKIRGDYVLIYKGDKSLYYVDTDEIPGFFLLLKNHIFIARSENTIFIIHAWGYWCRHDY